MYIVTNGWNAKVNKEFLTKFAKHIQTPKYEKNKPANSLILNTLNHLEFLDTSTTLFHNIWNIP